MSIKIPHKREALKIELYQKILRFLNGISVQSPPFSHLVFVAKFNFPKYEYRRWWTVPQQQCSCFTEFSGTKKVNLQNSTDFQTAFITVILCVIFLSNKGISSLLNRCAVCMICMTSCHKSNQICVPKYNEKVVDLLFKILFKQLIS